MFCTYVRYKHTDGRTDTITRNYELYFKLVLWLLLGRGSILDDSKWLSYFCSIMVLSKPKMCNSFNQLLIALSTMDSVFIVLALVDYSFVR